MKSILLAVVLTSTYTLLLGCGSSDDSIGDAPEDRKTIDDFKAEVMITLNSEATNCGTVGISENSVTVNTCVAESASNSDSFYAFYVLQGIDSQVASAISGEEDGTIFLWHFDSNPAGGVPGSPSLVEKEECVDPEFSGSVDSGHEDIFLCS